MSFSKNERDSTADERRRLLSVQATELDEVVIETVQPRTGLILLKLFFPIITR